MKYFEIEYEYKTRPLFRKGRLKTCSIPFAAKDITQAYELAKVEGDKRFRRHKWRILQAKELTVPNAIPVTGE